MSPSSAAKKIPELTPEEFFDLGESDQSERDAAAEFFSEGEIHEDSVLPWLGAGAGGYLGYQMADNPLLGAGLGAVAGGALGAMASDDDENESESVEECDLIPEDDFFGEASSAKNLKMSADDFFDIGDEVNESKKKAEDLDEGSLMTVEEFFKEAEMDEASKGKSAAIGAAAGAGLGLALAALGGSNAGAPAGDAVAADAPVADAPAGDAAGASAPVGSAQPTAGGEASADAITDPGTPEMTGKPDSNFEQAMSDGTATATDPELQGGLDPELKDQLADGAPQDDDAIRGIQDDPDIQYQKNNAADGDEITSDVGDDTEVYSGNADPEDRRNPSDYEDHTDTNDAVDRVRRFNRENPNPGNNSTDWQDEDKWKNLGKKEETPADDGSSAKEEKPTDSNSSTEEKPSDSGNEKAPDSSAEPEKDDDGWFSTLKNAGKNAGKKFGKALGFGGEEPAAAPAAKPAAAPAAAPAAKPAAAPAAKPATAPAAKPAAAPAAKTITSTPSNSNDVMAELRANPKLRNLATSIGLNPDKVTPAQLKQLGADKLPPEVLKKFGVDPDKAKAIFGGSQTGIEKSPTSGGPKTQAELQNPSKVKTSDAPAGGKTSSSSSGSSSGGSKPFFNDKSLKYGLTGAGIGGAVGYAMGDKRRRGIPEEEVDADVDPDDEQLEESLRDYIKNNATLFLG